MKRKVLTILTVLCALVFLISAGMLGYYFWGMHQARQGVAGLRDVRTSAAADDTAGAEGLPAVNVDPNKGILEANQALYDLNPDFAAWLTIEGTRVDYPVMYTPDNLEYYLRRDFDKNYNQHGTLFLGVGCDPRQDVDNLVIYGHNIQTGDMFADLLNYQDRAYWEDHRTLQLSTLSEVYQYEVVAAFYTNLDGEDREVFRYDHFVQAAFEEEYDAYVARVKALAYYDTGISCEYGEPLLTLSTCSSSTNSGGGRVVVVAKRITDD